MLADYDFELIHVPGKQHIPADFLSRPGGDKGEQDNQDVTLLHTERLAQMDDQISIAVAQTSFATNRGELERLTRAYWDDMDPSTEAPMEERLALAEGSMQSFPKAMEERRAILRRYHDHELAGHPVIKKTIALLRRWYQEGRELDAFVMEYIQGCAKCQETKPHNLKKTTPYPLNVPATEGPFQSVAIVTIYFL